MTDGKFIAGVELVHKGNLGEIYVLRNRAGMNARIASYGGTVMSLFVADARGKFEDVVLGHEKIEDYVDKSPYFGCLIGRYGNRIAKARFTLDGKEYQLAANNGPNSLHGGIKSFDKVVWAARPAESELGPALDLTYLSQDGEEGFPGNLSVTARYTVTEDNALRIDFTATTDRRTLCNLTHHSYFNLAAQGDILDHQVLLNAKRFTPIDAVSIPTGELRPVKGTPFDFTASTPIGARIDADDEQIRHGGGYDHNWVIDKPAGELGLCARVCETKSGRVMDVLATAPGSQLYSGNFLDGTIVGKHGWRYAKRSAFCIEPGCFPDTPNQPSFPSCVLDPGDTYQQTIIYKFSV